MALGKWLHAFVSVHAIHNIDRGFRPFWSLEYEKAWNNNRTIIGGKCGCAVLLSSNFHALQIRFHIPKSRGRPIYRRCNEICTVTSDRKVERISEQKGKADTSTRRLSRYILFIAWTANLAFFGFLIWVGLKKRKLNWNDNNAEDSNAAAQLLL